jgi:hypothetical protein
VTVWRARRREKRQIRYTGCGPQRGVSRESAKNDGSGYIGWTPCNQCNPEPRKTGLWVTSLSEAPTSARIVTVRRARRREKRQIRYTGCGPQRGVSRESAKNDGSGYTRWPTCNECNPEPRKTGLWVTSLSETQTSARIVTVWRARRREKRQIRYTGCGPQRGVSRESAKNDGSGYTRWTPCDECNPEPRKTGLWVTSVSEAQTSARILTVWRAARRAGEHPPARRAQYLLGHEPAATFHAFRYERGNPARIRSESRDHLGWVQNHKGCGRRKNTPRVRSPCPPPTA